MHKVQQLLNSSPVLCYPKKNVYKNFKKLLPAAATLLFLSLAHFEPNLSTKGFNWPPLLLKAFKLSMALSLSCTITKPFTKVQSLNLQKQRSNLVLVRCESKESPTEADLPLKRSKLEIGSPIIVIEAPKMIKSATSMPCLRVNSNLVKPGDVGRIVSRKPKDVWAVRLGIGTYLLDGKYFKPLELAEYS